jgi:lysozyme family protein
MATINNSLIAYLQKSEGGLSRATTDTASKSPSPYIYNGQKGWHTNKGITWDTFRTNASIGGYEVNQDNFIKMPNDIWGKILKIGYWNPMNCSNYTSQAIADVVVDFAWASGVGGAKKALIKYLGNKGIKVDGSVSISNAFNELVKKDGETKTFNDLIEERKRYFKSLNQPANERGWLNRMEVLRKHGTNLLGKIIDSAKETTETVKKNPIIIASLTFGIIITSYIFYKTITKNK